MVKRSKRNRHGMLSNLKYDLPASVVVFFVALPLCLGIALASGAPLLPGLIAGVVGGIVVGAISKSSLGVSGPAAGLATIVFGAIVELGSFEAFLVAGVLAGIFQIIFGLLKAGKLAMLFPSSVITGMLTGIGIIIFLKQIPHLFGYDGDVEGDFSFFQQDGETTFSEFGNAFKFFNLGAMLIALVSLAILIVWQTKAIQKSKIFRSIPAPLLVVVVGIGLALIFEPIQALTIGAEHFVNIPIGENISDLKNHFTLPSWGYLSDYRVWFIAVVIALVASIETLLCVEATDKLDPHYKNSTPTNRELIAQGIGNVVACSIGGIPITQVIVRSSANIQAGGKTKMAAIFHGFLILIAVVLVPFLLNKIPIAALAGVLTLVGYKLAKPSTFIKMFKQGWVQFIPYATTVLVMLFTDLLTGVLVGFAVSSVFILHKNHATSMEVKQLKVEGEDFMEITLLNNVTFLSKSKLMTKFNGAKDKSSVVIDTRKANYIHPDIHTMLVEFEVLALHKKIRYEVIKD
ncbi:MAG: SulP family inorganic anion transporter [Flavobacteriales bacterium]|nr:SulP family inorganic anion transporter [Flavobacteriales bacterium]